MFLEHIFRSELFIVMFYIRIVEFNTYYYNFISFLDPTSPSTDYKSHSSQNSNKHTQNNNLYSQPQPHYNTHNHTITHTHNYYNWVICPSIWSVHLSQLVLVVMFYQIVPIWFHLNSFEWILKTIQIISTKIFLI